MPVGTVDMALGIDPATEIRDIPGYPLRLNNGHVSEALYTVRET
jgi:hypothetical protein